MVVWARAFLEHRTIVLRVNDSEFPFLIQACMPQGSPLSPTIFLCFSTIYFNCCPRWFIVKPLQIICLYRILWPPMGLPAKVAEHAIFGWDMECRMGHDISCGEMPNYRYHDHVGSGPTSNAPPWRASASSHRTKVLGSVGGFIVVVGTSHPCVLQSMHRPT